MASLAILCFGDNGLVHFRKLSMYKNSLSSNVENLGKLNESLSSELAELQSDPERVEVMARDLGLFRDGDAVLRLSNQGSRSYSYEVGALVKPAKAKEGGSAWIKTSALASGATVCALFIVLRAVRRRKHDHQHR